MISLVLGFTFWLSLCAEAGIFGSPQHPPAENTASVKILVTNSWGKPLDPANIYIRFRRLPGIREEDYDKDFHNNYATGIPFGVYWLTVTGSAYSVAERLIEVNRSEVRISVGLFFRPIEDQEMLFTLSGRLLPNPGEPLPTSVRLVGLYAEFATKARWMKREITS